MSKKDPHKTAMLKQSTLTMLDEAKTEFKKYNPEMSDIFISNDTIIRRLCKYYLDKL